MLSDLERIQLMLNEDSHYEWIDADKIQKKLLILPLNKPLNGEILAYCS